MADEPDYGADCIGTAHTGAHIGTAAGTVLTGIAAAAALVESGKAETQSPWTSAQEAVATSVWGGMAGGAVGGALGYGGCETVEHGKELYHELNNYFNPPPDTTSPPATGDGSSWNAPAFTEPNHIDAPVGDAWSQGPAGVLSWGDNSPTVASSSAIEVASAAPSAPTFFENVHSVFESAPSWDSGGHDSGWGGSSYDNGHHDSGWGSFDGGSSGHDSGSHDSGTGMGDSGSV